jgi:hypothetical protein
VVGTVTNVHSASGSAFVKAFCDGMAYRGDSAGEALRDARNYFLSLAALKMQRGHKETSKVNRAALSFCLWGDPEMRLFAQPPSAKMAPLSAAFTDPQTVVVSTPKNRLPEQRSEKYFVRMFPGSQAAGVVKTLKNEEARRLMAFYFFRLPFPSDFNPEFYSTLQLEDGSTNRAVFLTDAFRRFVYLLYFPEKEANSSAFTLQFRK